MSLFWSVLFIVVAAAAGFAAGVFSRRKQAEQLERELEAALAGAGAAARPEPAVPGDASGEKAPADRDAGIKAAAKTATRPVTKSPVAKPEPAKPESAATAEKTEAPAGAAAAAAAAETSPSLPQSKGAPDDLKKISGVGPKLEEKLNGLGIAQFSQIAALTPDQVAWLDEQLKAKGRIERDDWIGQAKALSS